MTVFGAAWWRLAQLWVPVLVIMLANVVVYLGQTGRSIGREATLRNRVDSARQEIAQLESQLQLAQAERSRVALLREQLVDFNRSVLGSPDARLVAIMKEIGLATRSGRAAARLVLVYNLRPLTGRDAGSASPFRSVWRVPTNRCGGCWLPCRRVSSS